jgi:hypothetical protein
MAGSVVIPGEIDAFWLDDARLYWIHHSDTLQSCQKDDCSRTIITYGKAVGTVALGADRIYWQSNALSPTATSTLVTCPKTGCAAAPGIVFQAPITIPNSLSGDGDYVYWSQAGEIRRCASAGCGATPEVVATDTTPGPLTFLGSDAYWVSRLLDDSNGLPLAPAQIRRAPKDGSEAPFTVVADLGKSRSVSFAPPASVATDGASVFWVGDSNHVVSCPISGCGDTSPAQVVTSNDGKTGLQVDTIGIYWQQLDLGGKSSVHFCPLTGCGAISTTVTANNVYAFALDDSYVYWMDFRTIYRVAKPAL